MSSCDDACGTTAAVDILFGPLLCSLWLAYSQSGRLLVARDKLFQSTSTQGQGRDAISITAAIKSARRNRLGSSVPVCISQKHFSIPSLVQSYGLVCLYKPPDLRPSPCQSGACKIATLSIGAQDRTPQLPPASSLPVLHRRASTVLSTRTCKECATSS